MPSKATHTTTRILMQISRNTPSATSRLLPRSPVAVDSQFPTNFLPPSIVLAFQKKANLQTPPRPPPHHTRSLLWIPFPWLDFHSGHPTLVPPLARRSSPRQPRLCPPLSLLSLSAGSPFFTLPPAHVRGTQGCRGWQRVTEQQKHHGVMSSVF